MSTWITLSVVALIPMIVRLPKAVTPLRVDADDPSRFAGAFRRYKIQRFTGYASDVGKRSDSTTTGEIRSNLGTDGKVASVYGSIQTTSVVADHFFLTDGDGNVWPVQLEGFNVAVGDGHLVSAAWVFKPGKNAGPYFLIHNHTSRQSYFNKKSTQKVMTFPYPVLYTAALTLMLLPFPVVIVFAFTSWWQIGGFKKSGVKPLLASLEADAAKLTRPPPTERARREPAVDDNVASTSSELQRLADLHEQGVLTVDEFAQAKAKLLT